MRPEDLLAYYWTGSVPQPSSVHDIGLYGANIASPPGFHYYAGTLIEIVFEGRKAEGNNGSGKGHICVYGKVLRTWDDGFCVEFVFDDSSERRRFRQFLSGLKHKNADENKTEKAPEDRRAGTD